jgi:ferritin-like metal-binding protein YciE
VVSILPATQGQLKRLLIPDVTVWIRCLASSTKDGGCPSTVLVSAAQAVAHYEIARYGTLKRWAEQLSFNEAKRLLDATLSGEKNTG